MAEKKTSIKHRDFVSEPMSDKPITAVPGIGEKTAEAFRSSGQDKASHVYGEYLVRDQREGDFKDYMRSKGCDTGQQQKAHDAMKEHAKQFL